MDKLWAPWRSKYVTGLAGKTKGCVFCRISPEKRKDRTNFVVFRREYCYAVLNIYPYNNGHMMIVPYRHINDTAKLKPAERAEFFDAMEEAKSLLKEVVHAQGFNIGLNLGREAGAGFPGHIHMHIVPRWKGDVNFMPVTANIKVISQSLQEVYKRLVDAHQRRH
ncbi:MAG: HIT domain-containing protein [Candidatus Omnitrophica bacterium]|nr:HIT domain-containing protein [Candidatus Omnitrophota bacterium]